jgi:type II secretory pathway pseudopilin PulG
MQTQEGLNQYSPEKFQAETRRLGQRREEEDVRFQKEMEEKKRRAEEERKMREMQVARQEQQQRLQQQAQQHQQQRQQQQLRLQQQPQQVSFSTTSQPVSNQRMPSRNERLSLQNETINNKQRNNERNKFISEATAKEYDDKIKKLYSLRQMAGPNINQQELKQHSKEIHQFVYQITGKESQVNSKIRDISRILDASTCNPFLFRHCLNITAEKLVEQSEIVICRSPATAFAFATVAVRLAQRYPDLIDFLIGHFYDKCPYTVPSYYFPREEGQSDSDYAVKVLKKHKRTTEEGENLETDDEYFERMAGYIYLYSAIPTIPVQNEPHPYGLKHAWIWLARLLNMEPRPITPTILVAFLEHAGFFLLQAYRNQFRKILSFIKEDYIKRYPPNCNAAKSRLIIYLEDYEKNGYQLQEPKGYRLT